MNRNSVTRILVLGTTAFSAYFYGKHHENRRILNNFEATTKSNVILLAQKDQLLANLTKGTSYCIPCVAAAMPAIADNVSLTATSDRVSEIMKYGFPGFDNIRSYSDFVLSYDRRNRIAHWVFEHLTPDSVARNEEVDRAQCMFRTDESIHPFFRSDNFDYRRSGYDRGHLAAAANHKRHQKHCEDTFFLTNISPQVGQGFNRDAWNRLETHVRQLTKTYPNVYVCTGPLFLPRKEEDGKMYVKYEVIGKNTVAVPTHFYKIAVGETADQRLHMEAYVMPNKVISDETPLQAFLVPPETIERAAGLLFYDKITKNQFVTINGRKV